MSNSERITAWELRTFLSRQVRKMRLLNKVLIVMIALISLGLTGHVIFYYNYLTDLKYDLLTEKAQVSSAIQYRTNLMPVLIESVVSFVDHENEVFNRTVDARERELTLNQQLSAELRKAIKETVEKGKAVKEPTQDVFQRIMAIAEQYPALVTSEAFQLLMKQVAEAESEIFQHRINYNKVTNLYTTAASMFPGNIYAALFAFPMYEYFEESQGSEWPLEEVSRWRKNRGKESEADGEQ